MKLFEYGNNDGHFETIFPQRHSLLCTCLYIKSDRSNCVPNEKRKIERSSVTEKSLKLFDHLTSNLVEAY